MFKIEDGRECFYQWDINRRIIVDDATITQVHFCNKTDECSLVVDVYFDDGVCVANVPNILLQNDWNINVYGYDKDYTKHYALFKVKNRSKPADYIYTETDIINWNTIKDDVVNKADKSYVDAELDNKLNKVISNKSSNNYIYDANLDGGIKEIQVKGKYSIDEGASIINPKDITFHTVEDLYLCNTTIPRVFNPSIMLYCTNNYSDTAIIDVSTGKVKVIRVIKKVVLDGSEGNAWQKVSGSDNRFYCALERLDIFDSESTDKLNNGYNIIGDVIGDFGVQIDTNPKSNNEFRIMQGVSPNSGGYVRLQLYRDDVTTLNELQEELSKKPITLYLSMLYEETIEEYSKSINISNYISKYASFPFRLIFEDFSSYIAFPTSITYERDIDLTIKHLEEVISSMGGVI